MARTGHAVRTEYGVPALDVVLDRARGGDQDALCELMTAMSPGLVRALGRRVRLDTLSARSALQDAWASAWPRLADFESASHLWRWVYRASVNRSISRARHEAVERRIATVPRGRFAPSRLHATDAAFELAEGRVEALVGRAVEQLPTSLRPVATLHLLHGLGIDEVASLLAVTGSAARMRLHRARVRLRRSLRTLVSV